MTDVSERLFCRSIGPERLLVIDVITDAHAAEVGTVSWGYHLFDIEDDERRHLAHLGNHEAALHFTSVIDLIK